MVKGAMITVITVVTGISVVGYIREHDDQPKFKPCDGAAACEEANKVEAAKLLNLAEFRRYQATSNAVTATLRDPSSAEFGPTFLGREGKAVCGYVNARNGSGEMTGMKAWLVTKDGLVMEDNSERFAKLWNGKCAGARI